jgi:hypothetical protein
MQQIIDFTDKCLMLKTLYELRSKGQQCYWDISERILSKKNGKECIDNIYSIYTTD